METSPTVPLTVLSFFCLSLLYLIIFFWSAAQICKFKQFIPEAWIAKWFYIMILVVCLVRSSCFGITTGIYIREFGNRPLPSDQMVNV